jgi:rhamnulokinase
MEMNLTNEIGMGGKVRLLKNIAGLWLLQECRRAWALEGIDVSYDELAKQAAAAKRSRRSSTRMRFSSPVICCGALPSTAFGRTTASDELG